MKHLKIMGISINRLYNPKTKDEFLQSYYWYTIHFMVLAIIVALFS